MNKKIIAVAGATGAQGGALVRAILADKSSEFAVRALTRKTDGEKAKELVNLGADVVAANFDRVDDLKKAFAGAYGAYLVTNFWEHSSPAKELAQAQAMAQAAKHARLEHVLWSTLEDTRLRVPLSDSRMPTLLGNYKVPHMDAKGEANRFFGDLGVPTTLFHTSFYWENLVFFGMGPKKGPDGKLAFTLPMAGKKLPGIAVADIGKCAYGVFKRGAEYIGKSVGVAGEHLTGTQMAAELGKALGQDVVYHAATPDAWRSFGFPGAEDTGNMFQYKADFEAEFCGARNLGVSRALNPALQTFRQWLTANKSSIPLQ
jgi:uncharacterized protein YbjT (DUF2867 family)